MTARILPLLTLVLLMAAGAPGRAENLLTSAPPRNPDGSVNALIEIPAGTNAKWEVNGKGVLEWEIKDGKPRVVDYLGYPGSYGMVPGTLQSEKDGGDGDPLDVIVLGPALERGALVPVRVVGVLRLTDTGERDDKLIAVRPGSPMGDASDLADLDARHPGATRILEIWFENYKGPGRMESGGFADAAEASRIVDHAAASFLEESPAP